MVSKTTISLGEICTSTIFTSVVKNTLVPHGQTPSSDWCMLSHQSRLHQSLPNIVVVTGEWSAAIRCVCPLLEENDYVGDWYMYNSCTSMLYI